MTFSRFAAVGVVITAADFVVFNLIVLAVSNYSAPFVVFANTASFSAVLPPSYALNSRFTFQVPFSPTGFLRYAAVSVGGRLLYNAAIFTLVLLLDADNVVLLNAAKVSALTISLAWNFIGFRYYALRKAAAGNVS